MPPRGLEEIECSGCVGVEVVKWDRCSLVVRRLGGGVHDRVRFEFIHELEHSFTLANIHFVMGETLQGRLQPMLVPSRVPRWSEEHCPLVTVEPVHAPSE